MVSNYLFCPPYRCYCSNDAHRCQCQPPVRVLTRLNTRTRSVAAKVLHSSYWTTILRTDSVRTHAVRRPISLASLAIPAATILTAVASVVTPLGLYEQLGIGAKEVGNFSYVGDTSAYFYGTSPRGAYSFSRVCYFRVSWGPCPFTNDTVIFSQGESQSSWQFPNNLTTDVPPILREVYSSGTHGIGTTVSNFFDIEWRQLTTKVDENGILNHGRPYPVNMFRQLDSVAIDDAVRLVEGLVVDAKSGGIGFRNHTVPQPPNRNVTWQEDLLFIEPVTSCVDTNLTLDYTESSSYNNFSSSGPADYRLTDRGGFVHLVHKLPDYNHDDPQANPDLRGRAYRAAMLNNFATMVYLNVTNPSDNSTGTKSFRYVNSGLGKSFRVSVDPLRTYRAASFSSDYGSYLFGSSFDDELGYPNPYNVTKDGWFQPILRECSGYHPYRPANINTSIFVTCGLVIGPPRRVDGGPQGIFDRGSKWTTPMYSCATAVRAIIKTVHFSTDIASDPTLRPVGRNRGLVALRVTNITAKKYPTRESYPLWGVEDTGRPLGEVAPIWGLVSPAYQDAGFPNLTVVKQPWLYLLGVGNDDLVYAKNLNPSSVVPSGSQNLPGAEFPFAAANTIYDDMYGLSRTEWPFDLSGRSDMAVFTRWQELAATPEGTAKLINLLWTDVAASAVVGTKGIMPPASSSSTSPSSSLTRRSPLQQQQGGTESEEQKEQQQQQQQQQQQPVPVIHVWPIVPLTRYHPAYGIPAFVLLVVLVALTAGALAAWWTKTSTVGKLRMRLQQLSAGRIFTAVLYPGESDFRMPPKQWSQVSGPKTVKFADGEGGEAEAAAAAGATAAAEAAEAADGEEQQAAVRDVQTPGVITVSSVGDESKVEYVEEMRPIRHDPYGGGQQHGGYIALASVGYGYDG
ncbi:hypothetical protein MYCTH_2313151 [Thermothelomyces thermophilus ATCC 42464]|uniref:Uncharacterized protein n=1 Tax=Thermothelomyces thermophilus (strain ATCC 42464 / BCRC 31852 / DSM 1799) TaxID=573729 RepID=G2QNV9_THET4|nr:uncharacterized protein MYCTH_2313151 [Thermothelomyces thermophilus ATCC 42464]AEO62135.1 hypothetical protein MYCTH_2313151 [Thermothelomyces thermophilus ATCC 42464]